MLALFPFIERRVAAPMVEFPLFASRDFVGANVIALIVTFAMLAQFFFIALYMQNILGYSPLEAGVRFLPATLMIVAIAPIAGRLTDRIGSRLPIAVGLSLVSVALFWLTRIDATTTYSRPLALVRVDGHGHGAGDLADVHGGYERRRRCQGGDRLGHPVDEQDGRRHPRRRGDRRRLPGRRPLAGQRALAGSGLTRPSARRSRTAWEAANRQSLRDSIITKQARWPRRPTTPSSAPSPPR